MLEDELREMFGSRVRTPPAAHDPADVAIQAGKGKQRLRRTVTGLGALVAFALLLGAATMVQIFTSPVMSAGGITFDSVYGRETSPQPPRTGDKSMAPLPFPIDVFSGTSLWTADGRKMSLTGVQSVMKVARVPAGWIYSDESSIYLLSNDGLPRQLRNNAGAWAVSLDGTRLAAVIGGTTLETFRPEGASIATATIKPGTKPEGFDGESKVVLTNSTGAFDHWSGGGGSAYHETWSDKVVAVFGAEREKAVGVVKDKDTTCLADLVPSSAGWQPSLVLGCGDLPVQAVRVGATRSPDGRWLAIPSATGLILVDLAEARDRALSPGAKVESLPAQYNCVSMSNSPGAWTGNDSVITTGSNGGAIACGTNGSRVPVQLPLDVSAGWLLVPRFGDIR
jgi:hypothetical protein